MSRILKTFLLILLFTFFGICKEEIVLGQGCSMNTTPISFGNYDVFSVVPLDAVGTITINCPWSVRRATVTLSVSSTSGTFNPRKMGSSAGPDLDYNVYTDVARTAIFGDGTGRTRLVLRTRPPGPGVRWNASISMYGRIPPSQDVSVGTYSDTLTATVTP